jgi:hypothetical protein
VYHIIMQNSSDQAEFFHGDGAVRRRSTLNPMGAELQAQTFGRAGETIQLIVATGQVEAERNPNKEEATP